MTGFFSPASVATERPEATLVPRCGACGLYRNCQTPKMPVHGDGGKRVLLVGEAPGETDDEMGRPFLGKAGQFLRECLGEIGVDLDRDAWSTNALICHPADGSSPDIKQISHCRPNLLNTIRDLSPRVIVTLGKSPLVSVIQSHWKGDVRGLERWVGWKIPADGHWICPTYHPSFLLRMRNSLMDRLFLKHLKAAFETEGPPPPVVDYRKQVQVCYEENLICDTLLDMHRQGGWLAFDYETNCLKPEYPKGRIVSCAFSNGEQTIAFPWVPAKGTRLGVYVGKILSSDKTKKIAANLKFEERWTRKEFGHGVANWGWDTMLAAHCLDNRPEITSLKFQSLIHFGVATYNEHIEGFLKNDRGGWYNRVTHLDSRNLLIYNGMDAVLEYHLAMAQRKEMGYG